MDYISASRIGKFKFCPKAYKHIYIDKNRVWKDTPYTIYGTSVHKALQINNEEKIRTKKDLSDREVVDVFNKEFAQAFAGLNGNFSGIENKLKLQGENSLYGYMRNVAPTIKPLYAEYKYTVKLKHFPIVIHGYIDVIEEDYTIIDYKTAGQGYKRAWSQSEVDKNDQLTLYAAAVRKEFDVVEPKVCIDLLPRGESYKRVTSYRTKENIIDLLNYATDMDKLVKMGIFMPNLDNCSRCDFKDICDRRLST